MQGSQGTESFNFLLLGGSMDVSQLTSSAAGSSGVQGMYGGGHHRHHKSISDQVNQMGTAIDNAVKTGSMTSDQAASLKKELADITQIMNQNAQTTSAGSTGQTSQSNSLSQLSDADRKKVFSELHDVRKQLFAASNTDGANGSSGASSGDDAVSTLFSQIDSDNNGSIDKSELTQFLAQIGANALGYNQRGTTNVSASAMSWSTFSTMA
jgi:polyhydroxyalkanoate synthesis regulator phasin